MSDSGHRARCRVLLVLWSGHLGGAENHVVRLARFLHDEHMSVQVAFLATPDAAGELLRSVGVPVHTVGMRGGGDLMGLIRFVRHVRTSCPDIVHLHQSTPYLPIVLRAATRAKVVYTEHTSLLPQGTLRRLLWRRSYSRCHQVLFVSRSQREAFVHRGLVGDTCGAVIPLGVDARVHSPACATAPVRQRIGYQPGDFVVGYVGRFKAFKRVDLLLRAASGIRPHCPALRVLIVGFGPAEAQLRALTAELGLKDVVRFVVSPGQVCDYQACMDVLVHLSEHESLGLSVLEAMALGKVVVVAPFESAREIVHHGIDGYILDEPGPEALGEVLLRIFRSPKAAVEVGRKAAARVLATHTDTMTFIRIVGIYDALLRASIGPQRSACPSAAGQGRAGSGADQKAHA